ncbi:MAG: 2-amino-4-hydroxy-6-hydroxymethyldihydropteridine diphosphokinase, partial [Chloroflexota bacterium]
MSPIDAAAGANTVYLGLGSNLGDRRAQLRAAIDELIQGGVRVIAVSSLYDTQPVGFAEQGRFLNAVVKGSTRLGPRQLLELVKGIEQQLGRQPRFRNGPRELDIDLLSY